MGKKDLITRLNEGVVIGDGGFVFALEKRGYIMAGPWTPECNVENPEAVKQLHREFLRAGSDVLQALTFYASDDKLKNRGNEAGIKFTTQMVNKAACDIVKEVASEGDALVAGGVSQTPSFLSGAQKDAVKQEFRNQVEVFVANGMDFLIAEYFEHVAEIELAIQVLKETKLPVMATMCIGPTGDLHGVSAGECAVRMGRAGADVVGVNCHFDPSTALETLRLMKTALVAAGLTKVHLASQPLAYHTPDAGPQGFIDLPEFPFALEPRILSRYDMHKYAREAYDLGVRYIGGCCGFEPYHTRAIAEELADVRGRGPPGKKHLPWGAGLAMHTKPWVRARANKEYWVNLQPASGRPFSAAYAKPDSWGVTAGNELLMQHAHETTKEEQAQVEQLRTSLCKKL